MAEANEQEFVTGGNVDYKIIGWNWVDVKGANAAEWHYWFQQAFNQGAQIVEGTYDYNRRGKRLRGLNLRIGGKIKLVNALHAKIEKLSGR